MDCDQLSPGKGWVYGAWLFNFSSLTARRIFGRSEKDERSKRFAVSVFFEPRYWNEFAALDDLTRRVNVFRGHDHIVRSGLGQNFVQFRPFHEGIDRPAEVIREQMRFHAVLQDCLWSGGMGPDHRRK